MSRLSAIGLMSGTSYDGVDVALINTDGEDIGRLGPTGYRPYGEGERALLRRAIASATNLGGRADRPGILAEAEALVTHVHAEAVEAFLAAHGMAARDIAVVGFHGQTVAHQPERGLTVQLGDGRTLAGRLGIPVVYDFRAADVAAGGQGAPVVPIFHRAMVRMIDRPHPVGVLNIGGVANVTFIDGDAGLIACDTGPGNALIDDFLRLRIGYPQDSDGRAAAGRVDEDVVERVLAHPFFARPPPKSLDRNAFRQWVADEGKLAAKSTEDGAATLTSITAAAVARAVTVLPRKPASWIVAGGGTRNATLMAMLAERLAPVRIATADAIGWSADALEAQAFAYLAVRSLRGMPITFPATTGAPRPLTGAWKRGLKGICSSGRACRYGYRRGSGSSRTSIQRQFRLQVRTPRTCR
jgi:anhydro-N-acetylmuramic acid kinase